MAKKIDTSALNKPVHIAFIMDGNGRWAKKRGLPRKAGHIAGADVMKKIVRKCNDEGIKFVSVFAFSTENWARPKDEVNGIMKILKNVFKKDIKEFIKKNVKIRISGALDERVPDDVKKVIESGIEKTKDCTGMTFNICFNYGGRDDILHAVNSLLNEGAKNVTAEQFAAHLFTAGMPDPDIVVRTSAEQRVSNYMLWQMAYSEFMFILDKHWPDMKESDVESIILEYNKRDRRFGKVKEN